MTTILIVAAMVAPLLSRRLTGDLLPPTAIVVTTWAGTLGLLSLNWLPYVPVSPDTWSLLVGTLFVLGVSSMVGQWAGSQCRAPGPIAPLRLAGTWVLIFGLFAVAGLAWYVYSVVSRFGWIFNEGGQVRYYLWTREIPSSYLFLQQFCTAAALLAWSLWLTNQRLGRAAVAAAAVAAVGTLVTTDRTQFFSLAMSAVFMYLLRHGPGLPLRRLLLLTVGAPTVLIVNFLAVGVWTGKTTADVSIRLRWPGAEPGSLRARLTDALQGGAVVYFYATSSYPALSQYLATDHPGTGGAHVVYPVARLFQRLGMLQADLPPAIPSIVTIGPREDGQPLTTNSYTFLFYPLEDFGIAGALLYTALVGLACGWAYGWARLARQSPARLLLAGQACTALALTCLVNKFNNTAWWYVLACTLAPFVVERFTRRPAGPVAGSRGPAVANAGRT